MPGSTLADKLAAAGISTISINLRSTVAPEEMWIYPSPWREISPAEYPAHTLTAAFLGQHGHTRIPSTVASAQALLGTVNALELLSASIDPAPENSTVVTSHQYPPESTWYGAGFKSHLVYQLGGLTSFRLSRFDILADADLHGGVLLERTLTCPTLDMPPRPAVLAQSTVMALRESLRAAVHEVAS